MKKTSKIVAMFFVFALIISSGIPMVAKASNIDSTRYVTDNAGMVTDSEESKLEEILVSLEQQTGIEYAVVTINSLNGDSIESAANAMFREMGLGKADKNNGLLLLISKEDRKFRLEVGYGLEGVITDTTASKIIGTMTPFFKESKYADGITNALSGTFDVLQKSGEYNGLDINNQYNLKYDDGTISKEDFIFMVIVTIFIIMIFIIASFIVRRKGSSIYIPGSGWSSSDSYSSDSSSSSSDFGGGDSGGGGASGGW